MSYLNRLYGSYENLKGGTVGESLLDLTGGVVETLDLDEPPDDLFSLIENASNKGALMGCGIVVSIIIWLIINLL